MTLELFPILSEKLASASLKFGIDFTVTLCEINDPTYASEGFSQSIIFVIWTFSTEFAVSTGATKGKNKLKLNSEISFLNFILYSLDSELIIQKESSFGRACQ